MPGSGTPINELAVSDPDHVIPDRIRDQLGPDLAVALAESLELAAQGRALVARRLTFVARCRMVGLSWDSVGWFLGITGQGARQQYAGPVGDLLARDDGYETEG
jgi:hypothetical protein